jgi:hypothetical protein
MFRAAWKCPVSANWRAAGAEEVRSGVTLGGPDVTVRAHSRRGEPGDRLSVASKGDRLPQCWIRQPLAFAFVQVAASKRPTPLRDEREILSSRFQAPLKSIKDVVPWSRFLRCSAMSSQPLLKELSLPILQRNLVGVGGDPILSRSRRHQTGGFSWLALSRPSCRCRHRL